jgi:hypothetical protein
MSEVIDYAQIRATLAQSRIGLDVALPALTTLVTEMFGLIEDLVKENERLQDRVWTLDRTIRSHDPLEGEDG